MLINWLRNKLWQRRRLLFRFHDGKRIRRADPLSAAIALHSHPKYLPRHLVEARNGDKEAMQIVADTATDIFGLQPLSPDGKRGLTLNERFEIMLGFHAYLRALKKNTAASLTSRNSTAATSPPSSDPTTSDT